MDISSLSLSSLALQRPDPSQMRAQLFKKTDADGSGTITQQELTDAVATMPKPRGGGESPDVEQMFAQMDTDSNGEVTEAEHTDFLDTMDAERGSRPPPPSGGFEGSSDILSSLLSALPRDEDEAASPDVSALIQRLAEFLQERTSSYNADGTTHPTATKSLFETDA